MVQVWASRGRSRIRRGWGRRRGTRSGAPSRGPSRTRPRRSSSRRSRRSSASRSRSRGSRAREGEPEPAASRPRPVWRLVWSNRATMHRWQWLGWCVSALSRRPAAAPPSPRGSSGTPAHPQLALDPLVPHPPVVAVEGSRHRREVGGLVRLLGRRRHAHQLGGVGHHVLRRRRLVVADVVDGARPRPRDRGLEHGRDVLDVDPREQLARLDDPPRRAVLQVDERVAARAVDPGEAEDVDRQARGQPSGLRAGAAVGAREGRLDRRLLVDPAALPVAVDRRRAEVARPRPATGSARRSAPCASSTGIARLVGGDRGQDVGDARPAPRAAAGWPRSKANMRPAFGRERFSLLRPPRGPPDLPAAGGQPSGERSGRVAEAETEQDAGHAAAAASPNAARHSARTSGSDSPACRAWSRRSSPASASRDNAHTAAPRTSGDASASNAAAAAARRPLAAVADRDQHVAHEPVPADPLDRAAGEAPAERRVVERRQLGQRRRRSGPRAPAASVSAAARANLFQGQTARQSSQP